MNGFHNISCIWSMKLYGIESFCGPLQTLKIGMLQVSAATNMTLNTMFWSFMSHQTYWLFRDKPTELIEGSRKVKSTHAMFIRRNLNWRLSWLKKQSLKMYEVQEKMFFCTGDCMNCSNIFHNSRLSDEKQSELYNLVSKM